MIKERYYILKEELMLNDLAILYRADKFKRTGTSSDDNDASQTTRIRTSTDIETKDGTITNNDEKLYGSWDHLDENASMNGINSAVNFMFDHATDK